MSSTVTPDYFFNVVNAHLAGRNDFWHIVNGPRREVWFVTESIAALSRASTGHLDTGHRVYGEESYGSLCDNFGGDRTKAAAPDLQKLPDITISFDYATKLDTIFEAKLVDVPIPTNLDASDGNLQYQMDMAQRVFPTVSVLGVIFVVHHLSRHSSISVDPSNGWYEHVAEQIEAAIDFYRYEWSFPEKVRPVQGLQRVKSLGGMFNGEASLGIALIQPVGQTYCGAATNG